MRVYQHDQTQSDDSHEEESVIHHPILQRRLLSSYPYSYYLNPFVQRNHQQSSKYINGKEIFTTTLDSISTQRMKIGDTNNGQQIHASNFAFFNDACLPRKGFKVNHSNSSKMDIDIGIDHNDDKDGGKDPASLQNPTPPATDICQQNEPVQYYTGKVQTVIASPFQADRESNTGIHGRQRSSKYPPSPLSLSPFAQNIKMKQSASPTDHHHHQQQHSKSSFHQQQPPTTTRTRTATTTATFQRPSIPLYYPSQQYTAGPYKRPRSSPLYLPTQDDSYYALHKINQSSLLRRRRSTTPPQKEYKKFAFPPKPSLRSTSHEIWSIPRQVV